MHRLSYHSHALVTIPAALDAIYAEAVAYNDAAGITGALLFLDERFGQILEGEQAAITGLFDRISRDPRHEHVTFDYLIETGDRLFPDWSMGRITNDTQADIPLARILAAVTAADSDTSIRQLRSLAAATRAPLTRRATGASPGTRRSPAETIRPAVPPAPEPPGTALPHSRADTLRRVLLASRSIYRRGRRPPTRRPGSGPSRRSLAREHPM
jgi:Sensors of blue-light using FAD